MGFRSEGLLTMEYRLPQNKYPEGPQQWETHRQIVERVREVPGVRAAALVRALPFSGNGNTATIEIVDQAPSQKPPSARLNTADPAYFETMGIPLLRGRAFSDRDVADAPPVVVVSEKLAERHWPGENPLGKQIRFPDTKPVVTAEVIGVVGDTKQYNLDETDLGFVYAAAGPESPHLQHARRPHRRRPDAVRERGPRGGLVRGSGAAGLEDPHPAVPRRALEGHAPLPRPAHEQLCRSGPGARRGRPLRRDLLFGHPAHARDRPAHGAGCRVR